jgi:hypothetical protein
VAGFEVTLIGRFWVTAEGRRDKIVALRSLLQSYQHQQVGGLSRDAKLDHSFDQYFALTLGG